MTWKNLRWSVLYAGSLMAIFERRTHPSQGMRYLAMSPFVRTDAGAEVPVPNNQIRSSSRTRPAASSPMVSRRLLSSFVFLLADQTTF